jgi:hypothetical protein
VRLDYGASGVASTPQQRQLAKRCGASVIPITSADKACAVLSLGPDGINGRDDTVATGALCSILWRVLDGQMSRLLPPSYQQFEPVHEVNPCQPGSPHLCKNVQIFPLQSTAGCPIASPFSSGTAAANDFRPHRGVTGDNKFHSPSKKPQLIALGAQGIARPVDAWALI